MSVSPCARRAGPTLPALAPACLLAAGCTPPAAPRATIDPRATSAPHATIDPPAARGDPPAGRSDPPAGRSAPAPTRPAAGAARAPTPSAPTPHWVTPDGKAARQLAAHLAAGRTAEAELLRRIASRPVAEWIGSDRPEAETRAVTEAATRAGREALLVPYGIPHRDCGRHSARGARPSSWNRTP
ncbi:glycoside hydrolase family 6 protein [Streptomyces sp. NPDC058659]|uniref:glycoside hydrolase family 6 protein n=1 Tax=unclassified Streptomyces TaxID=2593676 RepID=UPI00365AE179